MKRHRIFLAGAALALGVVSGRAQHHEPSPGGVLGLDLSAQGGNVDMLLTMKTEKGVELRHHRSRDGKAWSDVHPLPADPSIYSPHRGSEPQVASFGDHVVVVWTRRGTSKWGSGPLATALSSDGGATWTPGPNPADDGSTEGHAYADLVVDEAGAFYLAWLDSRDGGQGLRAAVSRDFGRTWSANATLDSRTCECCWNRLASAKRGQAWVLYRDDDPRDMAVAATADAGARWAKRAPAGAFGWKFEGCPHVGGGLAFTRQGAHALVWSGKEDAAGLHAVSSADDGRSWSAPVRVGARSAHHPDLAASGGKLAAVWDDPAGEARAVYAAISADGGRSWQEARRLSTTPKAVASHPIVAGLGDGRFVVAWTVTAPASSTGWQTAVVGEP